MDGREAYGILIVSIGKFRRARCADSGCDIELAWMGMV